MEEEEPPVIFALAPALAIDGALDYTRSDHAKIYKAGIRQVLDDLFNCEADNLFQFLKDVQDRADEMGWTGGILNITLNADEPDEREENLIENYGTLTLEQVVISELQYIEEEGRPAQDTYMLYKCLMASLTTDAKKKVSIWSSQYRIGENNVCSGVALLKVIIRESHLDTNATTNQIRTKLSSLDQYITTIDSDIGRFNQYVKLLLQSLTARNQSTSDLLINLFKGYGAASDEVFRAWLGRKQDDHEEGEEMTPDELMLAAKNKYDSMVEKGTWNAPTAEEKIVALEAKLETTVKNLNKKVSFELGKKTSGKKTSDKSKNKKGHNKQKGHPKTWSKPKQGDKKEVEHKGFTWYWCGKDTGGKCEKWRAHKPNECKGGAQASSGSKREATDTSNDKGDKKEKLAKKLKIAKAYVARIEKQASEAVSSGEETE
ncbi:hypothetical protein MHU86_18473 [Fragilaria crotonensis]|nr:hypothetical protein MHU86_18473 [Fragilaria crotonensis]